MADNVPITAGSGTDVATDQISGTLEHAQIVKLAIATDGSRTLIPSDGTDGLLVNLGANNDVTVTGTVTVGSITAGDNNIGNVDIVTVPAPLSTTGGGTEATAHRVTIANDSTGVLSVDDNGASISVDWNGTQPVTGAGTVTGALRVTHASDDPVTVAVQLLDDAIYASDAALSKSMAIGAVLDDAATVAITENQAGYLRMSSRRALLVEGVASGTAQNVLDTNSAAALTALQLIDNPVLVDDAGFSPASSSVMMAGFEADETTTDSVDEGDAGAARMTLDRKQIVTPQPHTAGGVSTMNASSSDGATALTSTAQAIKASAGQLYGYYIYNPNAAAVFVQFYNTAQGSVTVGTTNPLFMLTIPPASAANLMGTMGITFGTAMSWAATSTAGGNGAPSTALDAVCWYA